MTTSPSGKSPFPDFRDEYDGRTMRDFAHQLWVLLRRIRIDGPIIIGGGRKIDKYFSASATWDPGNLASGAQTTTTITVTGAQLASQNTVTVGFNKDLQGMQLTGYVSADDTVTVVLQNGTGGPLDLASGTLTVGVWRH